MATGPRSYTVAVDFVANKKQMDQIVQQFESQLAQMNPGTALYTSMSKTLDQLKAKAQEFADTLAGPMVNDAQIKKATRSVESFYDTVRNSARSVENAGLSNFILTDAEKRDLNTFANKISSVKRDLRAIEGGAEPKKNSREFLATYDDGRGRTGSSILADATATKLKSFNADKSLSANAAAFRAGISDAEKQLASLEQKASDVMAKLAPLRQGIANAQTQRTVAQGEIAKTSQTYNRSRFASSIAQATTVPGLTANYTASNVLGAIQKEITRNSDYYNKSSNTLTDVGKDVVTQMLQAFKIDNAEIQSVIDGPVAGLKNSIMAAIAKAIQLDDNGIGLGVEGVAKVQKVSAWGRNYAGKVMVQQSVDRYTAAQTSLNEADSYIRANSGKLTSQEEEYTNIQNDITNITSTLIPSLQSLAVEFENLSTILKAQTTQELQDELEGLTAAQQERQNAIRAGKVGSSVMAGANAGGYRADAEENLNAQANMNKAAQQAQDEAETFKRNLQMSVSRWMGAREIISYIRQGIRDAYNDIQNLDKAMTNIAVVTDFSVEDLWGQINDYMAIAKQYGVTTQGVYEVTQLYYQQGLGTADVMAATTETLKMARIAGISYSDAADGMTVAVRAFKMEMEDAAHVTDVYSKVAAVTASDTQELIEAMSKTASGAANVGSSFENTTAMIATMVEATRESPENIGSALKSIISRFGEMKKGSAFDEDGELIDVNKVQTALASVGVSLLDAQGQFRDFDDVIFELADKWDTLDKSSQRYVATTAAGNRQQSRFIALVSNAQRLREVASAAENADDAGLIQYSKTLDSLESKQANLKTSFQQFYMDILNGDFFKGIISGVTTLLDG